MIKASELRSRLKKGGFDAEAAERIVKGEIDAGNATDDRLTGSVSLDDLIEASASIRDILEPADTVRVDGIVKGGAALDEEFSDLLRATAINAENLVDYQREALPAIAKGTMAIGTVVESLVNAVAGLQLIVKGMDERLAAPVPPRGVAAGAKPLPHPSETPVVKAETARPATSLNRQQVHALLRRHQSDLIAKGDRGESAMAELDQIGKAIGALESSVTPVNTILKNFEIELG